MTDEHWNIIQALKHVRVLPGSFNKRFINNICSYPKEKELSPSQIEWMFRMVYTYRRQIPKTYERHKNNSHCSRITK